MSLYWQKVNWPTHIHISLHRRMEIIIRPVTDWSQKPVTVEGWFLFFLAPPRQKNAEPDSHPLLPFISSPQLQFSQFFHWPHIKLSYRCQTLFSLVQSLPKVRVQFHSLCPTLDFTLMLSIHLVNWKKERERERERERRERRSNHTLVLCTSLDFMLFEVNASVTFV